MVRWHRAAATAQAAMPMAVRTPTPIALEDGVDNTAAISHSTYMCVRYIA
jgi:hypothetical protein